MDSFIFANKLYFNQRYSFICLSIIFTPSYYLVFSPTVRHSVDVGAPRVLNKLPMHRFFPEAKDEHQRRKSVGVGSPHVTRRPSGESNFCLALHLRTMQSKFAECRVIFTAHNSTIFFAAQVPGKIRAANLAFLRVLD
jgi:hypothetical protein